MEDIHTAICETLEALGNDVEGWDADDDPVTSYAWHLAPLSPRQLARLPRYMASQLRDTSIGTLTEEQSIALQDVQSALQRLRSEIIPRFANSASSAIPPYIDTLNYSAFVLGSLFGWSVVKTGQLPSALTRRLANAERELAQLMPAKEELESKITTIVEAHHAAEALPTTLQELKATQNEVRNASSAASELLGRIKADSEAGGAALNFLEEAASEGREIKSQIEEAYQIATTKGLAASFEARAVSLNRSLYLWVAGLALALGVAMGVGYLRLEVMKEALSLEPFSPTRVWVQTVLTILSVAAPVWFAWISTKQIGQRFRIAEDYAFKASVAKAYEGYRREAVRIDPEFEKILFASALTRLDEAPLRLMETSTHGSPAHELANSTTVSGMLEAALGIPKRVREAKSKLDGRARLEPEAPTTAGNGSEPSSAG